MADILLRWTEMPRNCFKCPLFTNCDACEGHECGCGLLGGIGYEEDISEDRRRDDCPLVELPEHEDLISLKDAKTVIDRFLGYLDEEMIYRIKYKLNQDCPVVIPSNKEEIE